MLDLSRNHFELFDLPPSYRVDGTLLAERYRALQRALHPDRYAAAGEREKRLSLQAATRINEAFQILRDPLERARYLLSLRTGESGVDPGTTQDRDFLTEQLELREVLAEAKSRADPVAAVGEVLGRLAEQRGELVAQLEHCFEGASDQDLEAARELVRKLQFVARCRAEAESLEAELDDPL